MKKQKYINSYTMFREQYESSNKMVTMDEFKQKVSEIVDDFDLSQVDIKLLAEAFLRSLSSKEDIHYQSYVADLPEADYVENVDGVEYEGEGGIQNYYIFNFRSKNIVVTLDGVFRFKEDGINDFTDVWVSSYEKGDIEQAYNEITIDFMPFRDIVFNEFSIPFNDAKPDMDSINSRSDEPSGSRRDVDIEDTYI